VIGCHDGPRSAGFSNGIMRSRDFRSIFYLVAALRWSRSRFFSTDRMQPGKLCNKQPRYLASFRLLAQNWHFVCKDRSRGLRRNYNLSILLTFFRQKDSNNIKCIFKTKKACPKMCMISLHCKLRLYQNCHYFQYCDRPSFGPVYLASGIH
jgi:hypothetical protein